MKLAVATASRQGLPAGPSICATPIDVLKDYYATNGPEGVEVLIFNIYRQIPFGFSGGLTIK